MRHDAMAVGRHFHPRCGRDILHLRSAFPSGSLNRREVQLSLAGQALSLIYTPPKATFREKFGLAPGVSTAESARVKELEQENRELKRANEILKRAASFFGAELDRQHKK